MSTSPAGPMEGAVALVTGASSGIGAATARRPADKGAAVALVAGRGDRLHRLAEVHVTHAAVPHLIAAAATSRRQVSDIVNVSSTAGRGVRASSSVHNPTTFGLNGPTEALRQELLGEATRDAALRQIGGIEPLRAEDNADAIGHVVTRQRRVAVNDMLVRAGDQTW
ncbi:SDR family NAD(P)-dependent oxidoreductase [Streptomyces sp. NPDC058954]|uniref:SDR family NAD(P)-dependent oxidoreductase n=1 Tax=Streptomyces sp. NPDC058954 TaxID=3346677 RepID=UPI00367E49FC